MTPSFDDTATAFAQRSGWELLRAYWLFRLLKSPGLVNILSVLANFFLKLRLPIKWLIKRTVFAQFCGGENLKESESTIQRLKQQKIGTILDFAAEGSPDDFGFDFNTEEILRTVELAAEREEIPFCVFKPTGIFHEETLKIPETERDEDQTRDWEKGVARAERICRAAEQKGVKVLVDAEQSWTLVNTDLLVEDLMAKFNTEKCIVFHTVQMYLKDRPTYLKELIERANGFRVGIKLVRGAYLEIENERAQEKGIPSPVCETKEITDRQFEDAQELCLSHLDRISLCSGTHNEMSCMNLVKRMVDLGLSPESDSIYFAQLYGMSDHISVNLSAQGFNVAKYVPYGPVRTLMPYLSRRAKENTSVAGHSGRELQLLERERSRRNS